MQIQCDCGQFKAELSHFPKDTPGRSVCYCIDCQTFMHHLGRVELLDPAGGSEIIPVYPVDLTIKAGAEKLACVRLSLKGLYRWSTSCCQTPLANTRPGIPWVGLSHRVFGKDTSVLQKTLGQIKCRIWGKYATSPPPQGTSQETTLRDFGIIFPFLLKGFIFKKAKTSPFFVGEERAPVVIPRILSLEERDNLRRKIQSGSL